MRTLKDPQRVDSHLPGRSRSPGPTSGFLPILRKTTTGLRGEKLARRCVPCQHRSITCTACLSLVGWVSGQLRNSAAHSLAKACEKLISRRKCSESRQSKATGFCDCSHRLFALEDSILFSPYEYSVAISSIGKVPASHCTSTRCEKKICPKAPLGTTRGACFFQPQSAFSPARHSPLAGIGSAGSTDD